MLGTKSYDNFLDDYIKAGQPSSSPKLLAHLANSASHQIRLRVAENPGAPCKVLELLANDQHPDVRIAVGTNSVTPYRLRCQLADDKDANVRLGLAESINSPPELIDKLTEDPNPYVSCMAKQTKEIIVSSKTLNQPNCSVSQHFVRWLNKGGTNQPQLSYA